MSQNQNQKSSWETVWLPRIIALATSIMASVFIFCITLVKDFVKDFYSFKLQVSNQMVQTNTWISVFDNKQKDLAQAIEKIRDNESSSKQDHTTFDKSYYLKPDDRFRIIKE